MNQSQGFAAKEGYFPTADGLKLFRQTWQSGAVPPRANLIVLHGLKDHSSRYGELAARLTQRGFNVYAFDLRGHGRSEGRKVFVSRFSLYVDDLENFLAIVKRESPGRPVFLFGHSMGGTISARLVMTRSPDIRGLILSAAATQPGAEINPF
jgi:acylglycerol lipase